MSEFKIFGGTFSKQLTAKICDHIKDQGISGVCGDIELTKFGDGEKCCQYKENIRGTDVFIVQSTITDEAWMELFIMIDAARRASAKTVNVVMPYMGYTRQDRKTKARTPITAKLTLDMLAAAGADRILTIDLHNLSIQGFTNLPLDGLYGAAVFFDTVRKKWGSWVVVSPDMGGIKSANMYAQVLGADVAVVQKIRHADGSIEHGKIIGDINGRNCLLLDDMTISGGTLFGANTIIKENGGEKVIGFATHAPSLETIETKLSGSNIDEFYTTNSIDQRFGMVDKRATVLDISSLLGEAILRTHENKSISRLFDVAGF